MLNESRRDDSFHRNDGAFVRTTEARTTPEFDRFLAFIAQIHPAFEHDPELPRRESVVADADSTFVIAALYQFWQSDCPEGGQPYWSVRCWTMLIWQPVYLAVASVHGAGLMPALRLFRQKVNDGVVAGFNFTDKALFKGPQDALIATAGGELRKVADALLNQLVTVAKLRRLSAMRLLADVVLAALVRLQDCIPGMDNQRVQTLSQRWLAAMDLTGQSRLMPITLASGREQLALDRKGCCMHYRRHDGELCATCPKLKMSVRLERLRAVYDSGEH